MQSSKAEQKMPLEQTLGVPVEEQSPVSPRTPKWGAQRERSAVISGTLNSLERGRGDSMDPPDPKAENKGRRDPGTPKTPQHP